MATVKELLTNVANNTRKFLGTEGQLSLEEMSQGIGGASAESDFQTELIEEFSTILDRSVAPDNYVNGKEDGFADALEKRTDLVVTEYREYVPEEGSTGFKRVSVAMPNKLAQYWDKTLTELTPEDCGNVTSFKRQAYEDQTLLKNVAFPSTITSTGDYVFNKCSALTNVVLNDGLKTIGEFCFQYTGIKSIDIPDTVTTIGREGFAYTLLESIVFPDSVTSLGNNVTMGCSRLTYMHIGKGITAIPYALLSACTSIKSITFPEQITSIAQGYIAAGASALEEFIIKSTVPPTIGSSTFSKINSFFRILVPVGCGDTYKSATNWSIYANSIYEDERAGNVNSAATGALDPNKI